MTQANTSETSYYQPKSNIPNFENSDYKADKVIDFVWNIDSTILILIWFFASCGMSLFLACNINRLNVIFIPMIIFISILLNII